MYKSKINVSIGKIPFILSISTLSDIHVARKCHHQEVPVSIIGMGPDRTRKIPRKYIPKQNKVCDVILGWAHFAYMRDRTWGLPRQLILRRWRMDFWGRVWSWILISDIELMQKLFRRLFCSWISTGLCNSYTLSKISAHLENFSRLAPLFTQQMHILRA
jgi:hypothetical protein